MGVHFNLLDGHWLAWIPETLWQIPPEIWRVGSTFLVTAPRLGLLFDTYFFYSYMCELERGHPRFPRKEDLVWYLIFVCITILVSCHSFCPQHISHAPHISARIALCLHSYHGSWK